MKRFLTLATAAVLTAALASSALAWWNPDPTTGGTVICNARGTKRVIKTINDGSGGVIALWADARISTSAPLLYVQRVDAGGNVRWAANGASVGAIDAAPHTFSTGMKGSKDAADLVGDGLDGAFVTYARNGNVYINRFNASGAALWGTGRLVSSLGAPIAKPRVVADGAGGAWIAWVSRTASPISQQVRLMHYDALGQRAAGVWASNPAGIVVQVSDPSRNEEYMSLSVASYLSGALVAWVRSARPVDGTTQMAPGAARMLATGAIAWSLPTRWYEGVIDEVDPPLIGSVGRAVRLGFRWPQDDFGYDGRDPEAGDISDYDGTTGAWLAYWYGSWYGARSVLSMGVHARVAGMTNGPPGHLDALGSVLINTTRLQFPGVFPEAQLPRQVDTSADGGYFAMTDRLGAVRATRQYWDGSFSWSASGVVISLQASQPLVTESYGGLICVFRRQGATASDDVIVAQRVYSGGQVGDVIYIPPFGTSAGQPQAEGSSGVDAPHAFAFAAPQPNPATGPTALRFTLAEAGDASLVVYDASGRTVRTVVSGAHAAGAHTATWDLRDEGGARVAPGMYFARVSAGAQQATRKLIVAK